ncbi:MAG: hypothetical protein JO269_05185 [Burkholderiaceae bacterium]|nr:hypothetical protein [Burkholderiaceae bacterium]
MSNPAMPNIPGMGAMTDTFEFMKKLWGGMSMPGVGIPGMVMPTLSVEEINKQIADLKAVESWLTLNMSMLRSTIQALEVQSATLAALQSMSETMSAAMKPDTSKASEKKFEPKADEKKAAPAFGKTDEEKVAEPAAHHADKAASAAPAAGVANPAIWWNLLQDQFKQAVNTALATEKPESGAKASAKSAPKAKSAVKKAAAPRKRAVRPAEGK